MLIRVIVVMAIILIMSIPYTISSNTFKGNIRDKHLESVSVIIDTKILQYYVKHNGKLPESLDDDTLEAMGLGVNSVKDEKGNDLFTYKKSADNSFVLTYIDSQNNTKGSPNSGISLKILKTNIY